jgi:hypothetical protein
MSKLPRNQAIRGDVSRNGNQELISAGFHQSCATKANAASLVRASRAHFRGLRRPALWIT